MKPNPKPMPIGPTPPNPRGKRLMKCLMLDEIDEIFKGIAVNGYGVGIDFEKITTAENMYEKEKINALSR